MAATEKGLIVNLLAKFPPAPLHSVAQRQPAWLQRSRHAAESLGVQLNTLRYWLKEHRKNGGAANVSEEKDLRKRNAELEREIQRLKLEREILKKAAAFFAREQP